MNDMRKNMDIAADEGRHAAVLVEITSLGFGFRNEGAVLYNRASDKTPVYIVNPAGTISKAASARLEAAAGDEDAYLSILEDEGIITKIASPSANATTLQNGD